MIPHDFRLLEARQGVLGTERSPETSPQFPQEKVTASTTKQL